MTTAATPGKPASDTPERFQFRIRDLLLVMLLVGLVAALIVQRQPILLLPLLGVGALCLFLWRKLWMPATLLRAVGLVCGIAVLLFLMMPSLGPHPESTRRIICSSNLKQIVLALHNYHDVYNSLPLTYIADQNGRPIHSWRVLILPFMDRKDLYDQYRFDEPWDGPNNSKLADQIRSAYSCPNDHHNQRSNPNVETSYVVIVGDHTPWQGEKAIDFTAFTDGTANTIFVVEVHN